MSYKIVSCALMNHINNDCEINVPPSASCLSRHVIQQNPQEAAATTQTRKW